MAAGGLGANLATNPLLNSTLTNELASNLNSFGGGVGGLGGLQASLANAQGNNSFNPRGMGKMDNDYSSNNFGGSNFGGGRDYDGFNRGDGDRPGGFASGQGVGGGNRQNTNGSRSMSDTIFIGNVRYQHSNLEFSLFFNSFLRGLIVIVFFFQLPPNTTWQMLRDKFQEIGEVKFAEMMGNDRGMVRFASEWDAERAVCIL